MATIVQFQNNLKKISNPKYLELVVFFQIKKAEKFFIEAQKEQLGKGENNQGNIIGTYSQATEDLAKLESTRQPKIAGQPYNFEYYGDFFDDMVLDVFEDSASFYSDDPKTVELIKKYKGLFGLQPSELIELLRKHILPGFQKELRTQMQL